MNTDPPGIARLWQLLPRRPYILNSVTPSLLEQAVFSKPYFDRKGLIVAARQDRQVGFVHAGFAPNGDGSDLDFSQGIISQVQVDPSEEYPASIASELIRQAEQFLIQRGARRIFVGSRFPDAPFYVGIYGGSQLPGMLTDDPRGEWFVGAGYRAAETVGIWERQLGEFRTIVDRRLVMIGRQFRLNFREEPPLTNWWDTCVWGQSDRVGYTATGRAAAAPLAEIDYWTIQPLAGMWGTRAMGVCRLEVDATFRGRGIGTFLVAESLKLLWKNQVSKIEAQVPESNVATTNLFRRLGFTLARQGIMLAKETAA